jgi:ubiquinone/menaquinone biosynthesis C-methylase UbiE
VTSRLPVPTPGSRVLELGCGSGKTVAWLAGRELDLVAADFSPAALAMNFSTKRKYPGFALAVADARQLPFKESAFDMAFVVHVIGHMRQKERSLAAGELIRVLTDGGTIVFRAFSNRDFRFGRGDQIEPGTFRRGTGVITHYFQESEVLDLFSPLSPVSIESSSWAMRVAGNDLPREEITAIFKKS